MASGRDIWVFAYGSLMWRPDFDFVEHHSALLKGYHRALCVKSIHYRGVPGRPGLVVGLDRGGSCRGRAYRVPGEKAPEVMAYLDGRELINGVYRRLELPVSLADAAVTASAYVVNRGHDQYTGKMDLAETVALVLQGDGPQGTAIDYLRNTVAHLDELGIREGRLHQVLALAEAELGAAPSRRNSGT